MSKQAAAVAWLAFRAELDEATQVINDRFDEMLAEGVLPGAEKHRPGGQDHPQKRHGRRGRLKPPSDDTEFVDEKMLELFGGEMTFQQNIVVDTAERRKFRDEAAEGIAENTPLDKKRASTMINTWVYSTSSSDPDPELLGIKRATAKEFKLGNLPPWLEEKEQRLLELDPSTSYTWTDKIRYERAVDDGRKATRAMYKATQRDLKAAGIENVTVYRGFVSASAKGKSVGDIVDIQGGPMESWSLSPRVANKFASEYYKHKFERGQAGVVLQTEVPASRVLSYHRTGFGSKSEYEVVILEDPKATDAARVTRYYQ